MTATLTIIGRKHNHATIKVVGTAASDTATIDLDTLISTGQTVDGTPKVNLARARYSVSSSGDVTVTRNSVTVLKLFGHDEIECPTPEQNTHDIVVTFNNSAGGTIILEVAKVGGYSAINPAGLPY
jgi:hypothetical protein